ncbi:unnamed protein product [Effrenium voratum]|nr:unnamed protein product [Effrenium voratum]
MRLGACRWLGAQIRRAPGRPVTASAFTGASAAGSDAIRSAGLWELLEANGHYFNAHRMAALLAEVLEEPRGKARGDPRLQAYLQKAITSCHLYENLRELTAKDIAAAITSCREIGHPAAEDLSDVLVDTISEQLPRLSLVRVSFFITNFAKQQIEDTRFWKSAARAVADSSQPLTPQVVVSLLDAFRKSGLRSERLFQAFKWQQRAREVPESSGAKPKSERFDPLNQTRGATFEEEYAQVNRDLDEPENPQRRTWLSLVFLVLFTTPAIAASFLTAREWADPLVRIVAPDDTDQVQDIFFGGAAWLVSCVTRKSPEKAPAVLTAAAELLRPRGVKTARVHCWELLETKKGPRTLAHRFGFRDKPPVVMATKGKGQPVLLAATGLQAEELAAKVLAAVIPDEAGAPEASVREPGRSGRRAERVGKRPTESDEEAVHFDVGESAEVSEEQSPRDEGEEEVNLDAGS